MKSSVFTFKQGWDWTRELDKEASEAFFSSLSPVQYTPDSSIYRQGEAATHLFYIYSGLAVLQAADSDGKAVFFSLQGKGGTIGEVTLLEGGERVYTATALTHVEAGTLSRSEFNKLRQQHPTIDSLLMFRFARTIRHITMHVNDMMLLSTKERLINLIESAVHFYAEGKPETDLVIIPISQQQVSNILGITRQSTHRLLQTLTESGAISFRAGAMHVLPDLLAKLS